MRLDSMSDVFFSIILPVFNVENYLEECLDSLIEQDINKNEYEIICVDDGSTDSSPQILDVYSAREPNIIVVHQENMSVSGARNTGIDIAKGKYIWFVDSDDFVIFNVLSKIKKALEESTPDILFIKPITIKDGDTTADIKHGIMIDINSGENYYDWLWTRFYKRSIIVDSGIRFCLGIMAEDNLFCNTISPYIKTIEKYNLVVYCYRIRENSLSTTPTEKKIHTLIRTCKTYYDHDKSGIISHQVAMSAIYEFLIPILSYLSKLPVNKAMPYIKELKRYNLFPMKELNDYYKDLDDIKNNSNNNKLNRLKNKAFTVRGFSILRLYRKFLRIKTINRGARRKTAFK